MIDLICTFFLIIEATDESSGKTPVKPRAHADSLSDATDKENSLSVSKIMKAIGM